MTAPRPGPDLLCRWLGALLVAAAVPAVRGQEFGHLRVTREAPMYAEARKTSDLVATLAVGRALLLLEDGPSHGYYHVRRTDGTQGGYVYRTYVRRFTGPAPGSAGDPGGGAPGAPAAGLSRHLTIGRPIALHEREYQGYVTAVDGRLKIPAWVQYELRAQDIPGPEERTDDFRADTSVPRQARAVLADYEGSGFDRGHMAPAEDFTATEALMRGSFLLSNMAPQVGVGFNRHIWAHLEDAVRGWVELRGRLTVITGPVFEPGAAPPDPAAPGSTPSGRVAYDVIGPGRVAVPTHFFKVVVDVTDPANPEVIAFLLPNRDLRAPAGGSAVELRSFIVSVDDVEARTGLDLLSALPASVQDTVEATRAPDMW